MKARKILVGAAALAALVTVAGCKSNSDEIVPLDMNQLSQAHLHTAFEVAPTKQVTAVMGYVAAKQSWWDGKATIYLLDDNSEGYFIYNLPCTKEQYDTDLAIGTPIAVAGVKGEWSGEMEILGQDGDGAVYGVVENKEKKTDFKPIELTLDDDAKEFNNAYFTIKDVTLTSTPTFQKDDNTGDIYFTVKDANGKTMDCCVESYLTAEDTDFYKSVASLKAGAKLNITGYMYMYNNAANPHIVDIKTNHKETVNKDLLKQAHEFGKFMTTENNTVATITGYVAAKQSWWDNKATLYILDDNSEGYFVYNITCTKEQYDTDLAIGNKISVTGVKGEWSGQAEILGQDGAGATYKVLDGKKNSFTPIELTLDVVVEMFNNAYFTVKDVTLVSDPTFQKDDKTGDIYFTVKDANGNTMDCCIESYLTAEDTDFYKSVAALKAGAKINITGYMYIYNNAANPHIVSIK